MERSAVKRQEIGELKILYPDGTETGMVIMVRGSESKEVKKVIRKWDGIASKSKKGKLNFDQKEKAATELLAATIVGWTGYTDQGEEIECTEDEINIILTDPTFSFVRDQLDEYAGEVGNFLSIESNN